MSNDQFKSQAKRLAGHLLSRHGLTLSHSQALEAIACQYGARNWNTLRASGEPLFVPPEAPDVPFFNPTFTGHSCITGFPGSGKSLVVRSYLERALWQGSSVLYLELDEEGYASASMAQALAKRNKVVFSSVHVPAQMNKFPADLFSWTDESKESLSVISERIVDSCTGHLFDSGSVGSNFLRACHVLAVEKVLTERFASQTSTSLEQLVSLLKQTPLAKESTGILGWLALAESWSKEASEVSPFIRGAYDLQSVFTPGHLHHVCIHPTRGQDIGAAYLHQLRSKLSSTAEVAGSAPLVIVCSGFRLNLKDEFDWKWLLDGATAAGAVVLFEDQELDQLPAPLVNRGERGIESVIQVGTCSRNNMADILKLSADDGKLRPDTSVLSAIEHGQLVVAKRHFLELMAVPRV